MTRNRAITLLVVASIAAPGGVDREKHVLGRRESADAAEG